MIYHDALLAYLHFVFAFILVGALVAEAFVLRLPIGPDAVRLLSRIDLIFGLSAGAVVLAGLARVFWGAKDPGFYAAEPFFWAKIATFVVVGLLSIPPTVTFLRWRKALTKDATFAPAVDEVRKTRRLVMIEIHLFALIPLFAVLMARGIGAGS